MSTDPTESGPSAAPTPPSQPQPQPQLQTKSQPKPQPKPPPKRRLRRWLVRLAVLAIVVRIGIGLSLERLVEFGLGFAGLDATCQSASLSLTGGSLRLSGLALVDPDGDATGLRIAATELTADVSTWQLLFGEFVVSNVLASGLHVDLHRRADGSLVLPAAWTASLPTTPEAVAPATGPPSFELPLQVVAGRLHDIRLRVHTADATPLDVVLDATIADLGHREKKGRIGLRVTGDGLVDRAVFDAEFDTPAGQLDCQWQLRALGLDLRRLDAVTFAGIAPLRFALRGELTIGHEADRTNLQANASLEPDADLARSLVVRANAAFGNDGSTQLDANLDASGLTLRAIEPLLRRGGLRIEADGIAAHLDGGISLAADGSMGAHCRALSIGADVADAAAVGRERLTADMDSISLFDVVLRDARAGAGGLEIGALEIGAGSVHVTQRSGGAIEVAGVRITPIAEPATAEPATAEPATAEPEATAAPPPAFGVRLDRLAWGATHFAITDATRAGAPTLRANGLHLTGDALAFGREGDPGSAQLDVQLPGISETLAIALRLQPQPGGARVEADVTAAGLTLTALQPWLQPAGITSQLDSGQLSFSVGCDLDGDNGPEHLTAELANLRYDDGDSKLLALRSARLTGLRLTGGEPLFDDLRIVEPYLVIERSSSATVLLGLAFGPAAAAASAATSTAAAATPAPAEATTAPTTAVTGPIELLGAVLRLRRAGEDGAAAREVAFGIDGKIAAIAAGETVPFDLTLKVDQQIEALALRGVAVLTDTRTEIDAELHGAGIRGSALTALLPPHITSPLQAGTLDGNLRATLTTTAAGVDLDLTVEDFALRDRDVELAAIDSIELRAPVLSPGRVHIAALRVAGLRASIATTDDGLQLAGLQIAATPAAAAPPAGAATTPPTAPTTAPFPVLRLDELLIVSDGVVWRDRRGGEREPLTTSLRLELTEPWATADELDETAPLQLRLDAGVTPLLATAGAAVTLRPFATRPRIDATFAAGGIDIAALARVSPALAVRLGATESSLQLGFGLQAEIDLHRSDVAHFDFSRPFGAAIAIEHLSLRGDAGTELLAVPEIDIEARSIDPRAGSVLLRSIDIDSPRLAATRTAAGIEVAGLLIRNDAAPAQAPRQPAPAGDPLPIAPAGPEIAIDQLRVFGLGFTWRDTTTEPATHLPIDELDLELRRWSTRAATEPRPFAFKATVRGGPVEFERRLAYSSVLAGILGATTDFITGAADQTPEQRPCLDELVVDGHLQLFPRTKGHITTTLRGFELATLSGLAKGGGVDIADGVLDADVTIDLAGGGAFVKSRQIFTWLQVSEPPGGPISTYLKLPAPLDTVLFILRNDNGEQRIPLQLHVPAEGVGSGGIASAAVEALTLLIADAIASSPLRAIRTVTDVVGLTGGEEDLATRAVALPCAAGSAQAETADLDALVDAFAADPGITFVVTHALGAADLEQVAIRANPEEDLVRHGIARLRDRVARLEAERQRLAPEVQARYRAGQLHEATARRAALLAVDERIGATWQSLDAALDRLDGDQPRHRRRRTRAAALELGELRLAAVRAALLQQLGPDAGDRIEIRSARAVPLAGLSGGGRIVVTPRHRTP